jgi:hypothetical protein
MINVNSLSQALFLFKKLCKPGVAVIEITRPEVESLWTVEVYNLPNSKQAKKLQQLGWTYDEDKKTFSKFF